MVKKYLDGVYVEREGWKGNRGGEMRGELEEKIKKKEDKGNAQGVWGGMRIKERRGEGREADRGRERQAQERERDGKMRKQFRDK